MRLALIAAAVLFGGETLAQTPRAVPVEGQPWAGRLAAADAKWNLTFQTDGPSQRLAAANLVCWGSPAEILRGPILVLADGGLMAADVLGADKEHLTADSTALGAVKLPLELLAGIALHSTGGRHERDLLLDRIATPGGDTDRLVLDNGDELTGQIEKIGEEAVKLQAAVGPLEVKIERIAAVIFNPALRSAARNGGLRAWVGLADGSRLLAAQLLVDGETLQLTTADKQTWKAASKDLVFLQPLGGRATYLSDLKPDGYRHLPFLDLAWPYRADRNVTGGQLRAGGRLYLKGLGLHSAARLTYKLDGSFKWFQAAMAIDDSAGGRGSVGFRVLVDGKPKFVSPTVRGGSAPTPVSVEVSGARQLDLLVDYADRADEMDHADWLDAWLVK